MVVVDVDRLAGQCGNWRKDGRRHCGLDENKEKVIGVDQARRRDETFGFTSGTVKGIVAADGRREGPRKIFHSEPAIFAPPGRRCLNAEESSSLTFLSTRPSGDPDLDQEIEGMETATGDLCAVCFRVARSHAPPLMQCMRLIELFITIHVHEEGAMSNRSEICFCLAIAFRGHMCGQVAGGAHGGGCLSANEYFL